MSDSRLSPSRLTDLMKRKGPKRAAAQPPQLGYADLPRFSLEQALQVPRAIIDKLGSAAATWPAIAAAMKFAETDENKHLLWSALSYNLVDRDDEQYELTEVARRIVTPATEEESKEALVEALMSPVFFSRFFTEYNGKPLPPDEVLAATLDRDFGVPPNGLDDAKKLIRENGLFVGVLKRDNNNELGVHLDAETTGVTQPSAEMQTVRDLSHDYARICFVITPFGEEGSEQRKHADLILKRLIEPVVKELGLTAVRADHIEVSGLITHQIFEHLAKARVAIADLSFANPNAFYELGVRHALKLPTIQIIRKGDPIPFDVSQGRTIKIETKDIYSIFDAFESSQRTLQQYLKSALAGDQDDDGSHANYYLRGVKVEIPK